MARFLVGARRTASRRQRDCTIIDTGHVRERDLQIEIPSAPLEAVMSGDVWKAVYDRLAELVREHRTTLVFVNTRRQAERIARHLSERLGEEHVTAHHGSMAKELRLDAESRLKRGELQAPSSRPHRSSWASTSAKSTSYARSARPARSPPSCSASAAPATRWAARRKAGSSRCRATIWSNARRCWMRCAAASSTACAIPEKPLDVLAQQIVAEVAAREWDEDGLFALVSRAYPYRDLERSGIR